MKSTVRMSFLLFLFVFLGFTFTPARGANFGLVANVPIPGWTNVPGTGITNASFDLLSFDAAKNIMYVADRPNGGVTAINTVNNTVIGTIHVPQPCGLGTAAAQCVSGVQVAPNVAPGVTELIATDRGTGTTTPGCGGVACARVLVYNISNVTPANIGTLTPTATVNLTNALATDELTYDPINKRAYVNNTNNGGDPMGRYFTTVIDVNPASATFGQVLGQIPITTAAQGAPEQPRFDPVDCPGGTPGTGCIYSTTDGNNTVVRIDPNFPLNPTNPSLNAGAITQTFGPIAGCGGVNGIDINPANNIALLGCSPGPQTLMNLTTGAIVNQFTGGPNATDVLAFDPNLNGGTWFTASSGNTNSGLGCPASAATPTQFPVLGIFTLTSATQVCSGQGSHGLGVDTNNNTVYVPAGVFPANGAVLPAGVLVFGIPEPSSLLLMAFGLIFVVLYAHRRQVQS